jgi:hypothetical protein
MAAPNPGLRQLPLLVLVSLLFIGGMGGLLVLNINIQDLSFEYRALQATAQTLSNQEAGLRVAVNAERSPVNLAQRASALGMVPYPNPAVIRLADGSVSGELKPAVGGTLTNQIWNGQLPAPKLPLPEVVPSPKANVSPTQTDSTDSAEAGTDTDTSAESTAAVSDAGEGSETEATADNETEAGE